MLPSDQVRPVCSAKGCKEAALWVLAWNNPRIHTPERRKTWIACGQHREYLAGFLDVRDFLRDVVLLSEWQAREKEHEDTPAPE